MAGVEGAFKGCLGGVYGGGGGGVEALRGCFECQNELRLS